MVAGTGVGHGRDLAVTEGTAPPRRLASHWPYVHNLRVDHSSCPNSLARQRPRGPLDDLPALYRHPAAPMSSPILRSAVRGVVIDAVGTLIDPEPAVAVAYAAAAARQGVALDPAVMKGRFRAAFARDEHDEARGPLATDEATEARRWRRIVADCLPEVPDPGRAFAELWDHFGDPAHWRAFPDAASTLATLAGAGIAVRIASNFDGRLRPVLAGLPGLEPWSGPVLISSEVGWRKPHPEFYRAALSSLGLPAGDVVCVGDDLENDVHGPRRAGLQAVWLDRGSRQDPAGPTATVGSLRELAEQLLSRQ